MLYMISIMCLFHFQYLEFNNLGVSIVTQSILQSLIAKEFITEDGSAENITSPWNVRKVNSGILHPLPRNPYDTSYIPY